MKHTGRTLACRPGGVRAALVDPGHQAGPEPVRRGHRARQDRPAGPGPWLRPVAGTRDGHDLLLLRKPVRSRAIGEAASHQHAISPSALGARDTRSWPKPRVSGRMRRVTEIPDPLLQAGMPVIAMAVCGGAVTLHGADRHDGGKFRLRRVPWTRHLLFRCRPRVDPGQDQGPRGR